MAWGTAAVSGSFIASCAPPDQVADPVAENPDEIEGQLVTYVADFADGRTRRWHALRRANAPELELRFQEPGFAPQQGDAPSMAPPPNGTKIRVKGTRIADTLEVRHWEKAPALANPSGESDPSNPTSTSSALATDDPELIAAPATDTYGLVLVDLGSGVDKTAAQGQTLLFSDLAADKSFASYYKESSYGKYTVSGAVEGPFSYSMTTCDTSGMAKAIEAKITGTYNHLIYYFPRSTLCDFAGLGEEGSATRPAKRTWMNGSLSCVVLMQEPGHNLGLMHANTMKCGTSSFSTTPATSCTVTEYGSTMTTMGNGCKQLNAYERWYMQWLTGCNGVRVPGSGTVNLLQLETACGSGVQVLQVPFPATLTVKDPQATSTNMTVSLKNYYVELRTAGGTFDAYGNASRPGAVTFSVPTVFVYASDDVHVPTATGRNQNSVWTELLNMTPASTSFTGLTTAGQSFKDPAGGPTITLQAISATGATIVVDNPMGTGTPTCMDGSALSGAGPTTCGTTPGTGGTTGAGGNGGSAGGAGTGGRIATGGTSGTGGQGSPQGGRQEGQGGVPGGGLGGKGGTHTGGSPASGGMGPSPDAHPAADAATTPNDLPHGHDLQGGCDCEVTGGSASPSYLPFVLASLGLLWRRRRLPTHSGSSDETHADEMHGE